MVENISNTNCSTLLLVLDAQGDNKSCSHQDSFTFSPISIKGCVFFTHSFPLHLHISFHTLKDSCQTNQASPTAIMMTVGKAMCLLLASVNDCCCNILLSHSCATICTVLFRQTPAIYNFISTHRVSLGFSFSLGDYFFPCWN